MKHDCDIKRGQFIGKVHSLMQEFYFSAPTVVMKLVNVYATSFYGSNCYNLFSDVCDRLFRAWNVTVRQIFKLDRTTHRYLIETISECLHPKVILSSRFIKFHENNLKSVKSVIRTLANLNKDDLTTVYGNNLYNIGRCCNTNVQSLTPQLVKTTMSYFRIPDDQLWRVPIIQEMLAIRNNDLSLTGFSYREIKDILDNMCIS